MSVWVIAIIAANNDDIAPTLSEFYRILKKGGIVLLTTPNPEGIKKCVYKKCAGEFKSRTKTGQKIPRKR